MNDQTISEFDKKSEISGDLKAIFDKELIHQAYENKELKENNIKMNERLQELERRLKFLNIKNEDDDINTTKVKECIYNSDNAINKLNEQIFTIEKELTLSNGKIEILEGILKRKLKIDEVFKNIPEKDILRYFNDMTIKNIDKREDIKQQNKSLLEKLIFLGKEYKKLK